MIIFAFSTTSRENRGQYLGRGSADMGKQNRAVPLYCRHFCPADWATLVVCLYLCLFITNFSSIAEFHQTCVNTQSITVNEPNVGCPNYNSTP